MALTLLLVLACGPTLRTVGGGGRVEMPDERPGEPAEDAPDSLSAIRTPAEWASLAYRPPDSTVARTEVVKFIVDLEDDWRVYFAQSALWSLHYDFVKRFLDPLADHSAFNVRQYRRDDREYLLGSLVHYLDADVWSLELVAGDTLDAPRLARLMSHVGERVFFGERLAFRPLSPTHESRARAARIRVVDGRSLQAELAYQPLVLGVAYGYLRIIRDPAALMDARPNDIVVTPDVPEDLPPVAGLITARLQAPLAHVAVLSRSRGTPDMALREATVDPRLTALDGEIVRLTVGAQDMQIERATLAEAQPRWDERRPREPFVPAVRQPAPPIPIPMCDTTLEDADVVGAKAAQLGSICDVEGVVTPGGFVVPFGGFLQHRRSAGLSDVMLQQVGGLDRAERRAGLERLRERIENRAVDRDLLRRVRAGLVRGRRHIFRSSTNAEDLVGFSGAGLYRSVVVDADPTDAQIAGALRRVWASVYLERAWEERAWARIEQTRVAMAVLVQPFVDGVDATGVAVTGNPFTETRPAVFVNLQTRAEGVTSAGGDELPEQLLIYTWTPAPEVHVVSRSSRTNGAPILRGDEPERLTTILRAIHERLRPTYGDEANAVDVEVLLTTSRRFVIVQARPITLRYGPGQTY